MLSVKIVEWLAQLGKVQELNVAMVCASYGMPETEKIITMCAENGATMYDVALAGVAYNCD